MAILAHDVFSNLIANIFSSLILLVVGFLFGRWSDYTQQTRAFKRVFGKRAGKSSDLLIVFDTIQDTRLLQLSQQQQIGIQNPVGSNLAQRFFKVFPDGHITTIPGPTESVLPECSARGASYLLDAFRGVRGISAKTTPDKTASPQWNGTFVTLGSSYSNIKTDDIKHLPENPWLLDDAGQFKFKDGTAIHADQRYDKGLIMKLDNPHADGHALIICEGLGEWGTSGSAWFLGRFWRKLSKRFGKNPFLIGLRVTRGTDESARELTAFGLERRMWRIRKYLPFV
jgi:hypothetical protein